MLDLIPESVCRIKNNDDKEYNILFGNKSTTAVYEIETILRNLQATIKH